MQAGLVTATAATADVQLWKPNLWHNDPHGQPVRVA